MRFFETEVTSIDPGHWTEFFTAMSFVALSLDRFAAKSRWKDGHYPQAGLDLQHMIVDPFSGLDTAMS